MQHQQTAHRRLAKSTRKPAQPIPNIKLHQTNFAHVDFSGSLFAQKFSIIESVAVSPDGQLIAAGGGGRDVYVWRRQDYGLHFILRGHTDIVYSPPEKFCPIAGRGDVVRNFSGQVYQIAFSPDGSILTTAGGDQTIRLWQVTGGTAGQLLHTLRDDETVRIARALCFSPDGQTLASAGHDREITLWDVNTWQVQRCLRKHIFPLYTLAFAPDGHTLISGSAEGIVCFWDMSNGQRQRTFKRGDTGTSRLAVSPDGHMLVYATDGGRSIILADMATGDVLDTLSASSSLILALAFHADGRYLASGSYDNQIQIWQIASDGTGTRYRTLSGHTNTVMDLAFISDNASLVSGGEDQVLRIWDWQHGHLQHTEWEFSEIITSVVYSAQGQHLASIGFDRPVHLWDALYAR